MASWTCHLHVGGLWNSDELVYLPHKMDYLIYEVDSWCYLHHHVPDRKMACCEADYSQLSFPQYMLCIQMMPTDQINRVNSTVCLSSHQGCIYNSYMTLNWGAWSNAPQLRSCT